MSKTFLRPRSVLTLLYMVCSTANGDVLTADPSAEPSDPRFYQTLVDNLQPGDTLRLPAGTYKFEPDHRALSLVGLSGTPDAWITIEGPESGPPAIVLAVTNKHNAVQMGDNAYLTIRNITIDAADIVGVDGINTDKGITHDIVIENCAFMSVSGGVAINTKEVAWNWVIRGNTIIGASTGMYIGNPNGSGQFINGLIEGNLIRDTTGYNIQFKKQLSYGGASWEDQVPAGPHSTIVRNNVLIKQAATTRIRPSLMIRGFPDAGPNSQDRYAVYGNFFYMNVGEPLIYAVSNVSIHDNVLVTNDDYAIRVQNHDGEVPEVVKIYNNTIFGPTVTGIRFSDSVRDEAIVTGNVIFGGGGVAGPGVSSAQVTDTIFDSTANAGAYVVNPSFALGQMDFFPVPGQLTGAPLDLSPFAGDTDRGFDFNGESKGALEFRGAYAGAGVNPGWLLDDERKSGGPSGSTDDDGDADQMPPAPPTNLDLIP